jgi:hypothetical protein
MIIMEQDTERRNNKRKGEVREELTITCIKENGYNIWKE